MSKIIGVYGVIAGITVAVLMRIAMMLFPEGGTGGMVAGFASMIIALSFVFVGVKRYRDIELGGVIRFWKALGIGHWFWHRGNRVALLCRCVGTLSLFHQLYIHGGVYAAGHTTGPKG